MDAEARFNSFLDCRASSMNCPHCRRPFIKIDCYGELLVGCIECNRWGRPGDKTLVMELIEDDLQALKNARKSDSYLGGKMRYEARCLTPMGRHNDHRFFV